MYKKNKIGLLVLVLITGALHANAQSISTIPYPELDSKLSKSYIDAEDSATFRATSANRIEKLLEYSMLMNDENTSEQAKKQLVENMYNEMDKKASIYYKNDIYPITKKNMKMIMTKMGSYLAKNKETKREVKENESGGLGTEYYGESLKVERSLTRLDKKFGKKKMTIWVPQIGSITLDD